MRGKTQCKPSYPLQRPDVAGLSASVPELGPRAFLWIPGADVIHSLARFAQLGFALLNSLDRRRFLAPACSIVSHCIHKKEDGRAGCDGQGLRPRYEAARPSLKTITLLDLRTGRADRGAV
jgi:hypothetical protein